jgi:PAS domain S-box-containing protein
VLTPILCDGAGWDVYGWDVYELETDVDGSDGVLRRVRVRAGHVPDAPGWLAGVLEPIGTQTADVADRYQLLLELSPDALIVHDAGTIVYANPAAITFARAESLADLVGRPMLGFVAPESQPELLRRLAGLTEPGAVSEPSEAIMLRLDGTSLVMEAVSVRTSWNGKPAFQVIMRDLSERRAAEAVVRQQASLVEHVSDAIVAVANDGTVVTWNPAAERVFGYRADDVRGRAIRDVLGDDLAAVECCGGEPGAQRFEFRVVRADGRGMDVEVAVDPIREAPVPVRGRS